MSYIVHKMIRCIQHFAFVAAMLIPFASSATTVKALSFAIKESSGSNEGEPIKTYMATNDVDFGVFDNTKKPSYFIGSDFSQDGKSFKVVFFDSTPTGGNRSYKLVIYDSDKYELVNTPADDMSSHNVAAVFEDAYGDQYALISIRGTYTASGVNTYVSSIATKYPGAKIIVTYNARVGTSNADTLNASLTTDAAGPGMTCLGRTAVVDGETETAIGGVYMYPADIPDSYSVSLVPKLLKATGTDTINYNGTLLTFEVPTKYRVIFNDWDGTVIQTNIVVAGGSVTPPTPVREGYTFIGWDHPASDFESVTASFVATAQYDEPTLTILGEPEDFGTADPVYGITNGIAANDSFTASVTLPAVEPDATERWICTGYTHYQVTDVNTGARTVVQQGDSSSFSYTHIWRDELVWHFTNEWLVSASTMTGGVVSIDKAWVRNAETLTLIATPESGWAFWGWYGDTNGIADVTATTITPMITASRSLIAVFVPNGANAAVQYVAENGNDANSGYLPTSPKGTVQAAINTLVTAPGYGTVNVAAGLYETDTNPGVIVTNAIAVIGLTGNPEDVILRNTKTGSLNNAITLRLNHPDAFVANLVVEDGHRYQANGIPYGANLAIESSGGTVSNCVLRGGVCHHYYPRGAGAWLNSDSALLTHCVITNNSGSGTSKHLAANDGLFVHVAKGTVDNCLIAYNKDTGTAVNADIQVCSVTVLNGRLLNCTVVTNEARYTGGVYLDSNGFATNVVVAGCVNKSTHTNSVGELVWTDVGFAGTLANASHCASDGGEALTDNCVAGTATEFFRSMADCDYRPALASPLINKGVSYEGIASFDLLGKKRVQGRAPDIGAYESAPSGLSVYIR